MAYGYRRTTSVRRRPSLTRAYPRRTAPSTRRPVTRRTPYSRPRPRYVASATSAVREQRLIKTVLAKVKTNMATQLYGPLQTQVQISSAVWIPTRDTPFAFNMTNMNASNYGPQVYKTLNPLGTGDIMATSGRFTRVQPYKHQTEQDHSSEGHIVNGPSFYPVGTKLEFRFRGFVDNTHIRIDFVRCKSIVNRGGINNNESDIDYTILPKALFNMRGLAGFNVGQIPNNFEVIQTKKLFMNSKPKSSLADTAFESYPTTEGTTSDVKHCSMSYYWPKGTRITQYDTQTNESTGAEATSGFANGPYSWDNTDPRQQVWCIISTDDETTIDAVLTGDEIKVDCIRTCIWRDRLD